MISFKDIFYETQIPVNLILGKSSWAMKKTYPTNTKQKRINKLIDTDTTTISKMGIKIRCSQTCTLL